MIDSKFIKTGMKIKAVLVLLPCMGGNIMTYRYPTKNWSNAGYSLLLFNPPGHGKSEGVFGFENTSQTLKNEIDSVLKVYGNEIPIIGVGHSGGGSTLLKFFSENPEYKIKKIILLAPILDTVKSLRQLLENKKIDEFLVSLQLKNSKIAEIISDVQWLDESFWKQENLKSKINQYAVESGELYQELGTFLENIFIPTKTFYSFLETLREITSFILPSEDLWYPIEDSIQTAKKYQFPYHIIPNARNHFFRNAWKDVSNEMNGILNRA